MFPYFIAFLMYCILFFKIHSESFSNEMGPPKRFQGHFNFNPPANVSDHSLIIIIVQTQTTEPQRMQLKKI